VDGTSTNSQSTLLSYGQIKEVRLRELLVKWIIDRRHAFLEVEAQSFQELVEYLNPLAVSKVPKLANTIQADTMKCFETAKFTLRKNLDTARSKIHISFDLWTSPNYKAIIAVVRHWTNNDYKVETGLLGMKEITGAHKGQFISPVLHQVVKDFGIENNLGYFMTDNASNNDVALRYLERAIRDDGGIGFDVKERRLRCLGHILNIAVKVLLFGGKVPGMREDNDEMDYNLEDGSSDLEAELLDDVDEVADQ
jgi:hypothetical protein